MNDQISSAWTRLAVTFLTCRSWQWALAFHALIKSELMVFGETLRALRRGLNAIPSGRSWST